MASAGDGCDHNTVAAAIGEASRRCRTAVDVAAPAAVAAEPFNSFTSAVALFGAIEWHVLDLGVPKKGGSRMWTGLVLAPKKQNGASRIWIPHQG
jgi:hypothetical protein